MKPMGRKSFIIVLGLAAASLTIHLWIAARPDTMGDVSGSWRQWCRLLVEHGVEAYWHSAELQATGRPPIDHPPVYPYLLWIIGKPFSILAPQAFLHNDVLLDFLIKLPSVIADLLLAFLVFQELKRHASRTVATWGFAAVALNPALIFNTSYWGQTDSLCALGIAGAFAAAFRGRYATAWAAIVTAALVKPFGYVFIPLLALVTMGRAGSRGVARGAFGAVVATVFLFMPFAIIGRLADLFRELFLQLDTMPYVSANAHNLWWILGGGLPFVDAGGLLLGGISYKTTGLVLVGVFYLLLLWKWWSKPKTRDSWFYPTNVALGFFMLSTHMHENHLIYFIPLAAPFALSRTRARWIFFGLSITILMNMVLHDPELTSARLFMAGPVIEVPYALGGAISVFRLALTILNTQAGLLLAIAWVWSGVASSTPAADVPARTTSARFKTTSRVALLAAFLLLTSLPFVSRNADAKIVRPGPRHFPGEDVRLDMIAKLYSATFAVEESDDIMHGTFVIDGDARQVIFTRPGASVSFKLVVPDRGRFRFSQALPEEAWSQMQSDGVEFKVDVKTESSTINVHEMFVDPAHRPEQRRWIDADLDLGEFAGQRVSVVLYTTPGRGMNYLADWPGWGDPRIVAGE